MNFTNEIGPLYIRNSAVLGFDIGILTGRSINGQLLENVQLKGQRKFGILDWVKLSPFENSEVGTKCQRLNPKAASSRS